MLLFQELYGSMPGVVVPDVLLDYSGRRVITTEWVDGEKVQSQTHLLTHASQHNSLRLSF